MFDGNVYAILIGILTVKIVILKRCKIKQKADKNQNRIDDT